MQRLRTVSEQYIFTVPRDPQMLAGLYLVEDYEAVVQVSDGSVTFIVRKT